MVCRDLYGLLLPIDTDGSRTVNPLHTALETYILMPRALLRAALARACRGVPAGGEGTGVSAVVLCQPHQLISLKVDRFLT